MIYARRKQVRDVTYYLAPIANGLGDLIVSLPALQALIATGEPTYLIMRSYMQRGLSSRIEGLAGSLREADFDPAKMNEKDRYFNLRSHPLQADYIWGSEEFEAKYPGYKITDVMKGICQDWDIKADFDDLQPLPFNKRPDAINKVIFIPGSSGPVKYWPVFHWMELASTLKKDGMEVVVVGQPDQSDITNELVQQGLPHLPTPELVDALDVVSNASCVVAVDTGLMHMAVHQGTPTIGLYRYNTMYLRPYRHMRSFAAPMCADACIEREYTDVPNKMIEYDAWETDAYMYWKNWYCAIDDVRDRCMSQISPDTVFNSIRELTAERV